LKAEITSDDGKTIVTEHENDCITIESIAEHNNTEKQAKSKATTKSRSKVHTKRPGYKRATWTN
jgi:hypothetical protein